MSIQSNCRLAIKLDNNPNAIYTPGAKITGRIIFTLSAKSELRGLQIRIKGRARCQMDVGRTRFSSEQQYFYYCRDVFGKKHGVAMEVDAGEWIYPFDYELPTNIPYTTDGKYGEVYCGIKIILDIPSAPDKEVKLPLTIVRYEDLNTMPLLKYPRREDISKSFCWFMLCCLGSTPFVMSVSIPFSGFIPGQRIPITIEMSNQSHVDIRSTKITLKGLHTFLFDYPSARKHVEKYRLDYKLLSGVKSGKCVTLEESLKVPEMLHPSNDVNCKIFQITYVIKVTALVADPHQSASIYIPITVGSFPLNFREQTTRTDSAVISKRPTKIFDCALKSKQSNEVIFMNDM